MRSAVHEHGDGAVWDVIGAPSRLPGVSLAGFHDHGLAPVDIRAIPHSAVTLAVQFGSAAAVAEDAAGRQAAHSLAVGLGFGLNALRIRGRNFEAVQVRLSPLIVHSVLGVPPTSLSRDLVDLDALWGPDAGRLAEQLSELSSWDDRFALVDAFLARRCRSAHPADPEVAWAWHRIVRSGGLVRVDELADEVGWSRKRLRARFQSQIGLPPKRAAKLVRFDHAVHHLAAGAAAARVAADGGYADQSHLHRDVVALTGVTPATVADEPFLAVDDVAWERWSRLPGRARRRPG